MLDNKKAVIFDLDGTLIDSMWLWKSIDIEYLSRYNLEVPDDLSSQIEGMSFSKTADYFKDRFNLKDSVEKIKNDWNEMALVYYTSKVPFKKGALEFLHYLKSKNIKTGIATSNSRELATNCLKALDSIHLIDTIVTGCDVLASKPNPDVFIKAASNLLVSPKDCLVFEDIPQGIIAAKRARMKVCAVDDDYSKDIINEKKELADYFINDYFDLLDNIN